MVGCQVIFGSIWCSNVCSRTHEYLRVCVCVRGREATARFVLNLCCGWGGVTTECLHPSSAHLPLYVVFLLPRDEMEMVLSASPAATQYLITRPCGCTCTAYTRIGLPTGLNARTRWGFDNYGGDNILLSFLNEELRLRCVAGQIDKENPWGIRCTILKMF